MFDYIIALRPYEGDPEVFGPFTLSAAEVLLKQAHRQYGGDLYPAKGNRLLCWAPVTSEEATWFIIVRLPAKQPEQAFLKEASAYKKN